MTNGKIQDKISQPSTTRSGRVQMFIHRTIQTEKYQSLVMGVHVDEQIQWTTLEDWFQKQKNWETVLIRRYKEMHDNVLEELGHSEKRAFIKDGPDNTAGTEKGLAELDDLETLE